MSKQQTTGLVVCCLFVAIVAVDLLLYGLSYPTISQWMVRRSESYPFPVVAGSSFFLGVLTGHWVWPLKGKSNAKVF
jgi:hypothetical protein